MIEHVCGCVGMCIIQSLRLSLASNFTAQIRLHSAAYSQAISTLEQQLEVTILGTEWFHGHCQKCLPKGEEGWKHL